MKTARKHKTSAVSAEAASISLKRTVEMVETILFIFKNKFDIGTFDVSALRTPRRTETKRGTPIQKARLC